MLWADAVWAIALILVGGAWLFALSVGVRQVVRWVLRWPAALREQAPEVAVMARGASGLATNLVSPIPAGEALAGRVDVRGAGVAGRYRPLERRGSQAVLEDDARGTGGQANCIAHRARERTEMEPHSRER